jgi:hypothetical protein
MCVCAYIQRCRYEVANVRKQDIKEYKASI